MRSRDTPHPPSPNTHAHTNTRLLGLRRWVADKLHRRTDRLLQQAGPERNAGDIDALFAEVDATLRQTHDIYTALDARQPSRAGGFAAAADPLSQAAQHGAAAAGTAGVTAAIGATSSGDGSGIDGGGGVSAGTAGTSPSSMEANWEEAISRALGREEDPQCAICLAPLARPQDAEVSSQEVQQTGGSGGGLTVLSCSHAFHCTCLTFFEAFQIAREAALRCPCCRSTYARVVLD